jgi:parvulin-like peptidyl-prolyl isomerase
MNDQTKKISAAALVAGLAVAGTWAVIAQTNPATTAADPVTELFGDPLVAKGDGIEIKRSELDKALMSVKSAAAMRGQTLPPTVDAAVLQTLISREVLLKHATDEDRGKGKELFEKTLAKIKEANKLTDEEFEERLSRQLKLQNQTRVEWEKQNIDQATIQAIAERQLGIAVSDEQAKKYYEEHPALFEVPERVRAAHVLLSTVDETRKPLPEAAKTAKRKLAEEVLKRARGGEDFAKLATEYSEDPGSKDTGGEYTFPRGQMVPEFEAAAFTLNTNQISDIVTTAHGYHIIKVLEKMPANNLEYEKVQEEIKERMKQEQLQKQLPDYLEKLRAEANVEILDESLKPATPIGGGLPSAGGETNQP